MISCGFFQQGGEGAASKISRILFSWELEIAGLGPLSLFVLVEECSSGVTGYRFIRRGLVGFSLCFLRGKRYPVLTLAVFEGSVNVETSLRLWLSYVRAKYPAPASVIIGTTSRVPLVLQPCASQDLEVKRRTDEAMCRTDEVQSALARVEVSKALADKSPRYGNRHTCHESVRAQICASPCSGRSPTPSSAFPESRPQGGSFPPDLWVRGRPDISDLGILPALTPITVFSQTLVGRVSAYSHSPSCPSPLSFVTTHKIAVSLLRLSRPLVRHASYTHLHSPYKAYKGHFA
jgi:hypothetical protein